jgi:hypothetical protein
LGNGFAGLLFGAHEKEDFPVFRHLAHVDQGFFQFLNRFLKVDDVNVVSAPENVFRHFRVPSTGLMSESERPLPTMLSLRRTP